MSTVTPDEELMIVEGEEGLFARDFEGRLIRMDKVTADDFARDVTVKIDGRTITVKKAVPATDEQGNILHDEHGLAIPRATTIYDATSMLFKDRTMADVAWVGNPIPILCHRDYMDAGRRLPRVRRRDLQDEARQGPARAEAAARLPPPRRGHDGGPDDRVARPRGAGAGPFGGPHAHRAAHGGPPDSVRKEKTTHDCELEALARRLEIGPPRFSRREPRSRTTRRWSSTSTTAPASSATAASGVVTTSATTRSSAGWAKGTTARIAFDLDAPMGASSCVACGECMVSCPTGALTHRAAVRADPWKDVDPKPESVAALELIEHPIAEIRRAFRRVSRPFLDWNSRAIVRRKFNNGEVICREGEYGSTAFFVESGSVDVYLNSPQVHVNDKAEPRILRPGPAVHQQAVAAIGGRPRRGVEQGRLHHHRRPRPPALRQADRHDGPRRPLRRDDLHELLPPLGDRPRGGRRHDGAGDAPERALHHAAQPGLPQSPGGSLPPERHRHPPAERANLRRAPAQTRRCSASSSRRLRNKVQLRRCEPGEVIFRQGDLGRRWLLPRPERLRQGLADPPRRRARAQLHRPGGLLRRDRPALGHPRDPRGRPARHSDRHLHGARPRRPGPDHRPGLPRHRQPLPRGAEAAAHRGGGADARVRPGRRAERADELARQLPRPGADGGPEPPGARPGEMHAVRRVHQGLRRRARRASPG